MLHLTRWLARRQRPESRISRAYRATTLAAPAAGTRISLVLPVHNTPPALLAACIASIRAQTTAAWQLCIADDASDTPPLIPDDPRIQTVRLATRAGIAGATNAAIALATAPLIGFVDHDDTLPPHALATLAHAADAHTHAGLFFSDEDQLLGDRHANPYFKPGWNPDLLAAQNMVGHLAIYRRSLLDQIGPLEPEFDGSQDWALALRASRHTTPVHVPVIAYHWRQRAASFSATFLAQSRATGVAAVQAHLPPGAVATPAPGLPQWVRAIYPVPATPPLVSLVVPEGTAPADPAYPRTEQVRAAAEATGDILVFLAPGLRAAEPGWLRELVSQALRPEIGAAGGRIDRPGGRIAQAGLFLHPRRIAETLHPASDADDPGYRGQFRLARTVSAVSLDCLAIRRAVLADAGGLDPTLAPFADVDLCLRLTARGLRSVWTPYARLTYNAMPQPRRHTDAAARMRQIWGAALAHDPFLNPNLEVRHGNLAIRRPPGPAHSSPGHAAPRLQHGNDPADRPPGTPGGVPLDA